MREEKAPTVVTCAARPASTPDPASIPGCFQPHLHATHGRTRAVTSKSPRAPAGQRRRAQPAEWGGLVASPALTLTRVAFDTAA